jgi:hypothetical protein
MTEEFHDEDDLDEVLSLAQRRQKARVLKRFSKKIQRKKEIKARRMADTDSLTQRARRKAILAVKSKLSGGKHPSEMSPALRANIEKRLAGKKSVIDRLARKNLPIVRKDERQRLKDYREKDSPKDESYEFVTEGDMAAAVREKHRKERDRELDQARLRDTLRKNQSESLKLKSDKSGIPFDILKEVYSRGVDTYDSDLTKLSVEEYAFNRVNSFIRGGYARKVDFDLAEQAEESIKEDAINLVGLVAKTLNKVKRSKSYAAAVDEYLNIAKNEMNPNTTQLAVGVAMKYAIRPREFIEFVNKHVNKNNLPKTLVAHYDPTEEDNGDIV